ncbi:MAG: GC-type dockerin domain-anchored protein [Phycisphaerales bacterium JB052]
MNRIAPALIMALAASGALAGGPTSAYIIEGSAYFGAPGIELTQVGRVDLSDPSMVEILPTAGIDLRFGGADLRPGTGELVAFENTTNAMRILDTVNGGNTLIDSIGFMDSGVAGMSYSNDGSLAYVTTTVGAFMRILTVDADTGAMVAMNNIITDPISSLAVVPEGHPTLNPGDLYGLALTAGGSVRLVRIDLEANTIASTQFVSGVGFSPQFETGLDFASDGTLYALIQGYDEISPDVFVEISSHLYTIDPASGAATDLGVVQGDGTWDAVTLVIDDAGTTCPADLTGDGELNFFDVSAFLNAFAASDPIADFTGDGSFNFFDVSTFLNAFSAGCP